MDHATKAVKEPAWNMANHVNNLHFFAVVFTNTITTIVAATAVEEKMYKLYSQNTDSFHTGMTN